MYGIKKKEEEIVNLPRKCLICETQNSPDSEKCCRCGRPLDLKTAIMAEERQSEKTFMANKQN